MLPALLLPLSIIYVITMYVDGGLIPTYFLYRSLGLVNSFAVYWLPGMTSAFFMLVIRTYIRSISESLIESARIEGAGDFWIFVRIVLPLCVPVLATVTLFIAGGIDDAPTRADEENPVCRCCYWQRFWDVGYSHSICWGGAVSSADPEVPPGRHDGRGQHPRDSPPRGFHTLLGEIEIVADQ